MDLGLEGSVAVVVGGASGIGLAIARGFAAEGGSVGILDVDPGVQAVAARLGEELRRKTVGFTCDITSLVSLEGARDAVFRDLGAVDHVVIAAAVGSGQFGYPFLNVDPRSWERVLRVNVLGPANVAHVFAADMMRRRGGTLLFLASVAGQMGSQTDPPYSASKAAVINFTQCAAKDLAPYGVRVNAICPGMVQTHLNRSVWEAWSARQPPEKRRSYEDWAGEKVRSVVPLGRWQEPEDMAHMAVFLASERARNVTGQTINVDGGYVMR